MRRLGCLAVLWTVGMAPSAAFAAPPTVVDKPGQKFRFLSLAEARAIALEHGRVGQPSLLFPGIGLDCPFAVPQGSGAIRVLAGDKPGSKSIILTGIRRHPRPVEMERNINQLLLNIENAYWNLYGSYWQLHSREQAMRFAYETWKITGAQFRVGKVSQAALAQAEGQYNLFRSQRLQALDTVLDNERQLWAMTGLPIEDGVRLVPSDAPTLVEKKPDWKEANQRAMKHRPELFLARQDVKKAQGAVELEKYYPLLDPRSSPPKDANTYNDWTFGGRLGMPLGFRLASAQLRQAQLQLSRAYLVLQDQELKAERFLGLYYRRMSSAYSQIKAARAQHEAFATQLQIRYELYRAGANEPGTDAPVTLNLLLESQRFWAEALATEYQAIVTYNNAIAGWEYAKGDIMKHAHVRLGEEPPYGSDSAGTGKWGAARAVVREHMRTLRHVRHEEGVIAASPLTVLELCSHQTDAKVPSLPALWKCFPPLQQAGEVSASDDREPLVERPTSDIFPPQRRHVRAAP